jgi:hypothetical protein
MRLVSVVLEEQHIEQPFDRSGCYDWKGWRKCGYVVYHNQKGVKGAVQGYHKDGTLAVVQVEGSSRGYMPWLMTLEETPKKIALFTEGDNPSPIHLAAKQIYDMGLWREP